MSGNHEGLGALAGVPVWTNDGNSLDWEDWKYQWVVYVLSGLDGPYYVGLARDVRRRLSEHRRAGLTMMAERVTVLLVHNQAAAQRLEAHWIALLRPSQNAWVPQLSNVEVWWYRELRLIYNDERGTDERIGYSRVTGDLRVTRATTGLALPAFPSTAEAEGDWADRAYFAELPHWYPDEWMGPWRVTWWWLAYRIFPWLVHTPFWGADPTDALAEYVEAT